jgi:glutamate-1-semialdehyde 2,1-aminomutase
LPVGAYGGRRDIMNMIAPMGPVYQAGTLSGNPLAMAAGLAMLEALETPNFYPTLEVRTARFCKDLRTVLAKHGRTWWISQCASIFHLWPKNNATHAPANYTEIKQADSQVFTPLFLGLLKRGVMIAPSAFEVGFVSSAHTDAILEEAVQTFDAVLAQNV